ncbi:phage tail protein [Maridesulfovibrio ferrireducens]|uniref:phage tail protein n=1 Tax=Maridesulfovibrio ferrireducens TaxID=246191 RepID=UPI001A1F7779|nr:phage tail protein [Maridesulfovibrio ferrireducens]MBI9109902.1 phage tail protein [Maridesulfovibrio ferrireducens]
MKQLQNLSKFLLEVLEVKREQLECFADRGDLILTGKDLGNCVELGRLKYDAVFWIEKFHGDANLLLAHVMAWLSENDLERHDLNLPDPEVDISLNNRNTANVEIAISFEEPLLIVLDEEGPIFWNGKKWSVSELKVDVAEELVDMDGKSNEED